MTTAEDAGFRVDPPYVADERAMLDAWLDFHRGTLLWKCEGLSGEDLVKATTEPSNLTLLGLVRHMAEVERWWFRRGAAQQTEVGDLFVTDEYVDGDFDLIDAAASDADLKTFEVEVAAARDAVRDLPLDHTAPHPNPKRGGDPISLRWIYLHMIEEYARHNGHADLLRERLDGRTGD